MKLDKKELLEMSSKLAQKLNSTDDGSTFTFKLTGLKSEGVFGVRPYSAPKNHTKSTRKPSILCVGRNYLMNLNLTMTPDISSRLRNLIQLLQEGNPAPPLTERDKT